ncbi:MAG: hypothetical protein M0R50_03325 [Candidatus Cloacimonetes bacterium]|jgi:hypothetical protein|nr:hypothetical protein [Candidatus Cloacimonadota bacterium]
MKPERKPTVGTIISVLQEVNKSASVCTHDLANRDMCTIIPLEQKPNPQSDGPWMLSCWGNGAGIACFLDDWDGKPFRSIEIISVGPKSVIGMALK